MSPNPLTAAATAHREALEAQRVQQEAVRRRDAAVRAAHEAGHGAVEIAEALGVNRQRVYLILGKRGHE